MSLAKGKYERINSKIPRRSGFFRPKAVLFKAAQF